MEKVTKGRAAARRKGHRILDEILSRNTLGTCCQQWGLVLIAGASAGERGICFSDRAEPVWNMGDIENSSLDFGDTGWESLSWLIRFCPFCGKRTGTPTEAA